MQQRIEQAAALAERVDQPVGQPRLQQTAQPEPHRRGQLGGHRLDHRARRRGHVHRQPPAVQALEQPREAPDGAAAHRQRTVPGRATEARPRPADLLLGDHDRVERAARERHREAAELADRVADAFEQLRVLAHQEACAEVAAGLLVAQHAQDQIPGRAPPGGGRPHERGHHHRHAALHVERPAAPHEAVVLLAAERIVRPAPGRRNHVDVPLHQQRRRGTLAGQARDQVGTLGVRGDDPGLTAEAVEQPAHPLHALALVARRVRRVEAQQLREQLGRAVLERVWGHGRTVSRIARCGRDPPPPALQRCLRGRSAGNTTDRCHVRSGPARSASAWSPCP